MSSPFFVVSCLNSKKRCTFEKTYYTSYTMKHNIKFLLFATLLWSTSLYSASKAFIHTSDGIEEIRTEEIDSIKTVNNELQFMHTGDPFKQIDISQIDSITFFTYEDEQPVGKIVGGDISMLPRYEAKGNPYYDINGNRVKPLEFFKELGWNSMRVRLFVEPNKASREDIGSGVVQDLPYVIQLGKKIKAAGFKFMLDFHYSDSWADPAKQTIPDSWKWANANALNDTLYNYTKRCLNAMKREGLEPDFIQIGNEISYGMLWNIGKCYPSSDQNWNVFAGFLNNASKACREICPKAKIIIHIERSGQPDVCYNFYKRIQDHHVDYDIIGLSYYPFWHNDLSVLSNTLNKLANGFPNKPVQIVETAYYYQWYPNDGIDHDFRNKWPATPEGQRKYTEDLINELKKHNNVNALYWWFPEENGNGVIDNWINRGLFDDNNGKALPAIYELGKFK